MKKVRFTVEKMTDENTGVEIDHFVKITEEFPSFGEAQPKVTKESWGSVLDYDRLFNTCVGKWGNNWDLEKVIVAIQESEIR